MAGIGEKRKNKKEQATPDNFLEACKKTCQECGSTVSKGVGQISEVCFGKESLKNGKKGQAVKVLGKTAQKVGDSFQKNFQKVTFKSALADTSGGLAHFFRSTKNVGSQFLNDLFS